MMGTMRRILLRMEGSRGLWRCTHTPIYHLMLVMLLCDAPRLMRGGMMRNMTRMERRRRQDGMLVMRN